MRGQYQSFKNFHFGLKVHFSVPRFERKAVKSLENTRGERVVG